MRAIRYKHGYKCNVRVHGRQVRRRFPFRLFGDTAKRACLDYIRSCAPLPATKPIRLHEAVSRYLQEMADLHKKLPSTIHADRNRLLYFCRWAGDINVADITPATIKDFSRYVLTTAKPATHNRYISIMRVLLMWCRANGYLAAVPPTDPALREQRTTRRWFTTQEVGKILAASEGECLAFFSLLAFTGVRASEAESLRWSDIDLDKRTLSITGRKTFQTRTLPLPLPLIGTLAGLSRNHAQVFTKHTQQFRRDLAVILKQAGIPHGGLHAFRHGFGTEMARSGESTFVQQRAMGHSRVTTTAIYTHISNEDVRGAVERLTQKLTQLTQKTPDSQSGVVMSRKDLRTAFKPYNGLANRRLQPARPPLRVSTQGLAIWDRIILTHPLTQSKPILR